MEKEEVIKLLQTILFMYDEVSEYTIMVEYGLGQYIKKARKVIKVIEND